MFKKKVISLFLATAMASMPFAALADDGLYEGLGLDNVTSVNYKQAFGGYAITKYRDSFDGGSISFDEYAFEGENVTITVTPDPGCQLKKLQYVDSSNHGYDIDTTTKTFVMIGGPVRIDAEFEPDLPPSTDVNYFDTKVDYAQTVSYNEIFGIAAKYGITGYSNDGNTVTASVAEAAEGDEVTLTPNAKIGYEIESIAVKGTDDESLTVEVNDDKFTMPAYSVTVSAVFKKIKYNLNSSITPENAGNVTYKIGDTVVTKATVGDTVSYEVTANAGYVIDVVSGYDGATATSGEFTMPAAEISTTVEFKPAPNYFDTNVDYVKTVAYTDIFNISQGAYKVNIAGMTNGTVTASPSAADAGAEIQLTITPATGYQIKAGTLSVMDAEDKVVSVLADKFTMPDSDVTVSAEFEQINYTVSIATGITNGTVSAATTATYGQKVSVTATPASENYVIDTLTYQGSGSAVAIVNDEFTMPAENVTINATFKLKDVSVTKATGITNGDIAFDKTSYKATETVTITPSAANGYEVNEVLVNGSPIAATSGVYTYTLGSTDITVSATFKAINYTVSVATGITNGTVSAATTATYGQKVSVTATPASENYVIDTLTYQGSGSAVAIVNNEFTMPAENVTINATFKLKDVKVTKATDITNGDITFDKEAYKATETLTITPSANTGYEVETVTVNGEAAIIADGVYTYVLGAVDVVVSATFKAIDYTITAPTEIENGAISVATTAKYNEEVTVSVTPNDGYTLASLSYNDGATDTNIDLTTLKFTMPAANVTISATFAIGARTVSIKSGITNGTVVAAIGDKEATDETQTGKLGDIVTITATPNGGYELTKVLVGTTEIKADADKKYLYTLGAENIEISAEFTAKKYKVNISNNSTHGDVTFKYAGTTYGEDDSDVEVAFGDTVEISVDPDSNYTGSVSVSYKDDDNRTHSVTVKSDKITMPAGDVTITASFKLKSTNSSGGSSGGSSIAIMNPVTTTTGTLGAITVSGGNASYYGGADNTVAGSVGDGVVKIDISSISGVNNGDDVLVVNENGDVVAIAMATDNTIKFSAVDGKYTLKSAEPKVFKDVTPDSWFKQYVDFVTARGIMNGVSEEFFEPEATVTRAMAVTTLQRMADSSYSKTATDFSDVPADAWYATGVAWAVEYGIANGVGDGMFDPNASITREQLAVMIVNYLKNVEKVNISANDGNLAGFADADSISSWAVEAVNIAVGLGILTGRTESTIAPKDNTIRAELATMLQRAIKAALDK